jgi:hypothetical protein
MNSEKPTDQQPFWVDERIKCLERNSYHAFSIQSIASEKGGVLWSIGGWEVAD